MKVLFLAAEAAPWIKVGGLADVAGELPRALGALGMEMRLVLPLHPGLDASGLALRCVGRFRLPSRFGAQPGDVIAAEVDGLSLLLIDGEPIRSAARVYDEPEADAHKYVFFSLGSLAACELLDWPPEVVHAHDWHAAPAIARLTAVRSRSAFWKGTAAVLTVHNLSFMGSGGQGALAAYDLAPADDPNLPDWARPLPLPLGMAAADWLTTVSPTYAGEMQTPEFGCGLEQFLQSRADRLTGILNGLDRGRWDPATDPALVARFTADTLEARRFNKRWLQSELDLPMADDVPLLAMVTRMDRQKGIDLALEALDRLRREAWQFVLLGSDDPALEAQVSGFASTLPERVRFLPRFDPLLSRRIYGGADALLVPSRYEPCGLAQMIAMRYGCLPIVRAVGGLKDTVSEDTGFLFERAEVRELEQAVLRALVLFRNAEGWRERQRRAMAMDFGWERSARRYVDVYRKACKVAAARTAQVAGGGDTQ